MYKVSSDRRFQKNKREIRKTYISLHEVMDRAYKNKDYYKNNPMLKSTFDFLKMVVDSWFAHE